MARLYISAHEDNDLVFMSPSLMDDLASGVEAVDGSNLYTREGFVAILAGSSA